MKEIWGASRIGEYPRPRGGLVITLKQHFYTEGLSDKTPRLSAHFSSVLNLITGKVCKSARLNIVNRGRDTVSVHEEKKINNWILILYYSRGASTASCPYSAFAGLDSSREAIQEDFREGFVVDVVW